MLIFCVLVLELLNFFSQTGLLLKRDLYNWLKIWRVATLVVFARESRRTGWLLALSSIASSLR